MHILFKSKSIKKRFWGTDCIHFMIKEVKVFDKFKDILSL